MAGEEAFSVLKFPSKLWRIVNESRTDAINWGLYGKTILIDYNQFQAEYLECPIPKFKTRNMTSFVRQLNMYGFKKVQTQQKNALNRHNVHEFFHENFRFGRPDLLNLVKRRAIPFKLNRRSHEPEASRLHLCRDTFDEQLLRSKEFLHFWKLDPLNISGNEAGAVVLQPQYKIRIIPADNAVVDRENNILIAELSQDYQGLLNEEENTIEEDEESEIEDDNGAKIDSSNFDLNFDLPAGNRYTFVTEEGNQVQVKNGFDGSNYIIDVLGTGEETKDNNPPGDVIKVENGFPAFEVIREDETFPPILHIPDSDDLFTCLSNAMNTLV